MNGTGKIAQLVKTPATKPEDLSLVSKTHTWWRGRTDSSELSFDLHMCPDLCVPMHTHVHTHKQIHVRRKKVHKWSLSTGNSIPLEKCKPKPQEVSLHSKPQGHLRSQTVTNGWPECGEAETAMAAGGNAK